MDAAISKGSLPDGWIVKVSRHFPDRVYYFNINTGSTTWECPKLYVPGTNKNKKSNNSIVQNKQASHKPAVAHLEVKSKIEEFLSDAKRESLKRSTENEIPSVSSKPSTPPTAIVAPVVLDKNLSAVTKKKKKKRSKSKNVVGLLKVPHTPKDSPPGTILQRKDSGDTSNKVSFTIKSQNKIPLSKSRNKISITKSQDAILQKSKSPTPFKKKQSLVISVPTTKKQSSASLSQEKRHVTLDAKIVLPSSDLRATSKKTVTRAPSLHQRFSPLQSRNSKQNSKIEKQCELFNQNQFKENNKRKSDALNTVSGEVPSTSKSAFSHESDSEMSVMDCEMTSDYEDLVVTVSSSSGVNVGASTSKGSDPDISDIEMLDMSSSDLVTIDDIFGFQESLLDRYFIAVDTNVFISELQYIDEMKDTPVNGCGPPHFIIPWVVFQELDNLKRNGGRPKPGAPKEAKARKTYDVMKLAGEAIRFLNTLLKAKHPRFHFQHPDEAKNCRKDFSRNNDDQLLECCLKLQERKDSPKPVSNPTFVPDPFKVLGELKSREEEYQANHRNCELEIDKHMSAARQMLKDVLDSLFEKEMDEAYGDNWHFFKIERHTLKGILYGITKYWRTVFTFLFTKDIEQKFQVLKEKASRPEGFLGERVECLNILTIIEELFVIIQRKWTDIQVPVAKIPKIKTLTEEAFMNLSECEKCLINVENAIKQTEMSCCIEVFNHNWTVINQLCGCACDFCGITHEFVYERNVPFPPKSEFLRIMPKLHNSLDQLKDVMERMLHVVKSSIPNGAIFKELHKILMELVPSLNIQAQNLSLIYFSAKLVERFCRLPENRARIEEGYKQLLTYYEKLGRAVCVLNEMP
ncbi:unnamed protein product [Larinioides sclopetarius]|uniref:WW domain-containing protein n=1 Tax=Larinioides sclopetarius TaxID=280406 RepID=A0AAV2AH31_9ARAC